MLYVLNGPVSFNKTWLIDWLNKRVQEPGESAESFISAVYKLSENCQYGTLQEEMIRDRLVVGIRHNGLSEKLQMDSNLTLQNLEEKMLLQRSYWGKDALEIIFLSGVGRW